ncbi:efflux RND transporter periplasmic adaptor subunit [Polaromonas sp. A23]|uniref:efflux RND transporter periplasmic adaptor subunit n=1 Tax=Polaromonas sp. A23 TaxID=1944133 RepID=UPI000985394E|nr:efflux RND transporter periplasmic adaptor subunit [Polaromonas sp. A23]OOG36597.1 efflux transporter periplasmic adaptor subunit [Polaromonas sp. A23]
MNRKHIAIAMAVAVALAAFGYAAFEMGMRRGGGMTAAPGAAAPGAAAPAEAGAVPAAPGPLPQSIAEGEEATRRHIAAGLKAGEMDPVTGRKVLYYHDPMVPASKFDKPAKSPFMNMMLVPVYADGDSDQSKVTVSPRTQQNLGVRTAVVTEGKLTPQVAAVGSIAFNERDQVMVQARATGFVERLHVRATLDRVSKGQPLAELYVPDWVAAQEEFLSLKRMDGTNLEGLVDGARQRMRQAGMSEEQIRLVERTLKTQARTTIHAPIGGVVVELSVREGMTVMAGAPLFRINGMSTVWANAEVPESQAALVRPGAMVQAQSPAVPGVAFQGRVQAILPDVNATTRTLKARLELANPGARLVPGMFVSMQFMDTRGETALLIPTEAVIQTGKRAVVMIAEENGKFRPVEVQAGIESGGQTEIKSGLQAGQRVVVSSQFLIDSEASLKGVEARLNDAPKPTAANTAARHEGEAKIEAIGRDSLTLSHGPIASLKMGAMTMEFKSPPPSALPRNLEVGDRVSFEFYMGADGPQLTRVAPAPSLPPSLQQPQGTGK